MHGMDRRDGVKGSKEHARKSYHKKLCPLCYGGGLYGFYVHICGRVCFYFLFDDFNASHHWLRRTRRANCATLLLLVLAALFLPVVVVRGG